MDTTQRSMPFRIRQKRTKLASRYTFNRKNDNDMRGQLYHDVLRLQGHLPRVAGVPAIVS